jgi:hypothetical protein
MTRRIADIASYQGALTPTAVRAAGIAAVNLKVSHGLGQTHVHPNVAGWALNAPMADLGVCTFHYLTGEAPGEAQAEYAYSRIVALGLTYGTAHQMDTEADAPWAVIAAYAERMQTLLGRPIALYTGDWWWNAKGRGWSGAAAVPYLWAAPNAGYLKAYPGDTSAAWAAGYGGWPILSVMQYAVTSIGGIDVSMSAIRDEAVWTALTKGRSGMSYAPQPLKDARTFWLTTVPTLDPLAVGIIGDDSHAASGTSYHLGKDALKSTSYSIVESARDKNGLTNAAAALDVGYFTIKVGTKTYTLRDYNRWLIAQCEAHAPDTLDIREVIYSLDGKVVKRWDRLGIRTTGDSSHLQHTHKSYFRDSENRDKTALERRWFTEIGYLEGDDMNAAEMTAWAKSPEGKTALAQAFLTYDPGTDANGKVLPGGITNYGADAAINPTIGAAYALTRAQVASIVAGQVRDQVDAVGKAVALILTNVQADDGDKAQILAALDAAASALPAEVLAELGDAGQTDEQVAAALHAALGSRAAAVGAMLARGA